MSNEEALAMLQAVQAAAQDGDDEKAHGREDDLRQRVLEAVMRGEGDAVALAAIALTSGQYEFSRWCG
jgi:hypothetical protein